MQESDMAFNFLEFHNKNKNPDPLRLSLKGASHDKKKGCSGLKTTVLLLEMTFCKFLFNFRRFGQFSMMGTFFLL